MRIIEVKERTDIFNIKKIISIICSLISFGSALIGLILGLQSIVAKDWGQLGIIFIIPSIFALLIIILDFLVTIEKIKKASVYSYISTLIKIGIIISFIPTTIYDFKYEMKYGTSNLDFDFIIIALLTVATIPSIFNIIKLTIAKKSKKV